MNKDFEKGDLMLLVGGNILHASNLKVSSEDFDKWDDNTSFEVTCDITDNTDIRNLFGKVCGSSYNLPAQKLPRKLKKAMKKLELCDQRRTRRMNYLMTRQ